MKALAKIQAAAAAAAAATAAAVLLATAAQASDTIPSAPQAGPLLFTGATLHTVSGAVIPNGQMLVEKGKISALGASVTAPAGTTTVDVSGKHIYPGMIAAYSNLGMVEIASVRATADFAEVGLLNPNARALVAINADSELIPVTRANGVLAVLAVPTERRGALITGTSALVQLDGWTWEEMGLAEPGLHVALPQMRFNAELFPPPIDVRLEEAKKLSAQRLRQLEEAFAQADAYRKAKAAGELKNVDVRWEAMLPALEGKRTVFLHAQDAAQIRYALGFGERFGLKIAIIGGTDAPLLAPLLKERDVPVIVAGTFRLPMRRGDAYDSPYTLPARLAAAGVRFAIAREGSDFESFNERNLPYEAGYAAAYGLAPEEALKAVTLYPAQILGVADKLGSLDAGKLASFIVTDGDPLQPVTKVEQAWIAGRKLDLSSRHTRLYEKYQEKYRQKAAARN